MLGRGGMGEVYRADDITLNQSVALKFLPALFGSDQKWLERFRNEVRLSRQVTHPNVCRVFDIGEFQGEQFISMEYVDGENLASLLRRIGRVPRDKAVQMARQLCAGLSAAHDRGVLHRDLKPANVMIDGRGSVRITDFGLAAPVDEMRAQGIAGAGGAIRAGTPAYMSPEQLAGKAVTVRSDVYSLGLVLYEMFTGRRAFRADSLRAYQKLHSSEEPTPPSEILEDIDPIVERVILKCLEKDPKDRPASAMAVSAALPGGSPLREILAAGETPSPEVVAAAGEAHGVMRPARAVMLLATALICLIGFVWMAPYVFVVQQALDPTEKARTLPNGIILDPAQPPTILAFKAQGILKSLGYTDMPADWAEGFDVNRGFYLHVENEQDASRLWHLWRPRLGMVYFWYRQSPELLIPARPEGQVEERDPSSGTPGMMKVRLDTLGRLIGLEIEPQPASPAIPAPAKSAGAAPATAVALTKPGPPVNWAPLFSAAGIDLTREDFRPTPPQGALPVDSDERAAWIGSFSEYTSVQKENVRIEAAAFHGKPVFFAEVGNWSEERLTEDQAQVKSAGQWNLLVQTVVIGALLLSGCVLAWRNYRSGRGDRIGAARMAFAFFLLGAVAWLFRAHHVGNPTFEFILFERGMGAVLYLVALMWIFYIALEPSVRRIWPETVISWSRLLAGKWFDPLVGRDVLAGAAVGAITTLLALFEYQLPQWIGSEKLPVPLPSISSVTLMLNATRNISGVFTAAMASLYLGLILLLYLVLARMATKKKWIAMISFVVLFAVATAHYRVDEPWRLGFENLLSLFVQAILATVLLLLVTRNGLVAVIFCLLVRAFLMDFPVTWDFSAWYAGASLVGIGAAVITLIAGFYAALGGRSPLAMADGE